MSQVLGSKGWRSGESAHLPPMWLEFKSWRRGQMWVEFVVGSLLCSERFFSAYSGFPSPQKPTFPNSNLTRNGVDKEPLCGCATSKSLFIYLFIIHLLTAEHFTGSKMAKWIHFRKTLRAPIWNINWRLLYVFLFFKSPSLWFKSFLEFKKAFM